jgi:nitrile hydratase beta subunit
MNGIHDMGGMHGLGPIVTEANEPVFHAPWEARAYALSMAAGALGLWTLDATRHQIESIPGPDYLRMSYYEKWVTSLETLLKRSGAVTREELETGRRAEGSIKATPPLTGEHVAAAFAHGSPSTRAGAAAPRFSVGERVLARNINPTGHTRLPRYVRCHRGLVTALHGAHLFPDTNAHGLGEQPQALYQVRFEARELWGEKAERAGAVYVDLWESYLEPA